MIQNPDSRLSSRRLTDRPSSASGWSRTRAGLPKPEAWLAHDAVRSRHGHPSRWRRKASAWSRRAWALDTPTQRHRSGRTPKCWEGPFLDGLERPVVGALCVSWPPLAAADTQLSQLGDGPPSATAGPDSSRPPGGLPAYRTYPPAWNNTSTSTGHRRRPAFWEGQAGIDLVTDRPRPTDHRQQRPARLPMGRVPAARRLTTSTARGSTS
jgi:hypothetical protein